MKPANKICLRLFNILLRIAFLIIFSCYVAYPQSGIITKIAGNVYGASGVGIPATASRIHAGAGIKIDGVGNIYIVESGYHCVKKINTSGILMLVAGVPSISAYGYSGDGGAASLAKLNFPSDVVIDIAGNIYIADPGNARIRKVSSAGIITTYAGMYPGGGSIADGIPATTAAIYPHSIALDAAGNLYLTALSKIRKIDTSGIITTIAGNGTTATGGLGDGGPATAASFAYAWGVAVDDNGNVYVSDAYDHRIRKIDNSGIITTIAGTGVSGYSGDGGPATAAQIRSPNPGICVDGNGNVYISDSGRIRKIDTFGIITTYAGDGTFCMMTTSTCGDGGPATAASVGPMYLTIDSAGYLYVSEGSSIRKISPSINRPPSFTGSHSLAVCENSGTTAINSLLAVHDSDIYQTETWSLISSPLHGAAVVTYTVTSTGGTLTPAGLTYTPTWGYTGADSFKVRVTDGLLSDTTTIYVTVSNLALGITGISQLCPATTGTLTDSTAGGTWSSSNIARATVNSTTGLVTGVAAGTVAISYAVSLSCGMAYAAKTITVNPLPAAITGTLNVCPSATTALSNTSGGGLWSSGATGAATVGSTSGIVAGVAAGTARITYTLPTGCYATAMVTVNMPPSAIIGAASVCIGQSITLSNGSPGGAWSKSNSNVNIGSTGTVTGVSAGLVTITYTLPTGCFSTKTMTVNAAPGAITGTAAVCITGSTTLTVTIGGGTWSSSNPPIAGVGSASGLVAGGAAGIATISYTLPTGCSSTIPVTVNARPSVFTVTGGGPYCAGGAGLHIGLSNSATGVSYQLFNGGIPGAIIAGTGGALDYGLITAPGTYTVTAINTTTSCTNAMGGSATISINPLPSPISGASSVCMGATTTLSNTGGGTWGSSSTGIATIGSATGAVNGVAIGSAIITYTLPTGCYTTTTMNVTSAPTAITGAGAVCAGANTTLASTPAGGLWSSSNTARATVNSTSGEVTGTGAGTVTITYSLGTGCTVTKAMTVQASPAAITGAMSLCAGSATTLASTTTGGAWSSSSGTATVMSGTVNGISAGTAVISYTVGGCSTTTIVTVNPVPAAIGGPATVCMGASVTETNAVAGGTWSTIAATVTVNSSSGTVTGVSAGTATITYALGSCMVTRTMTVNAAPTISGAGGVCAGSSITLAASTGTGSWSSSSMPTASVSSTGTVTGGMAGVATITFTPVTGCIATKPVTVNTTPSVISGAGAVCSGSSVMLTNTAGGGVWSSSSTATATVNSSSGTVTGVSAGTATISYSLGSGCTVTKTITVNALPLPITGTTSLCVGNTSALSAGAGSGGVWMSGNTSVAGVGSLTGIVTGAAVGTAAITYTIPSTGCITTTTVNITSVPAAIAGAGAVCAGSTIALTDATAGGVWSSSNPVVAGIGSATGMVNGLVAGGATITYSLGVGCTVTKAVTVNPLPSGITGAANVCLGSTTTLTTATTGGTWSAATTNATINSATGAVTGTGGGAAIISYTIPTGCAATYTLSVIVVPAIENVHSLCAWGDTIRIHNANPSGSYSSTLVTVTTMGSGDGIVTAFSPGTGTITYTLSGLGCTATASITVNPLPNVISGAMNICAGTATTLSNTAPGGAWSSSNTAVATIGSSSGLVAGMAAGTSTIAYTLPTGCKVDTVVTISTTPVAGTITGAGMICTGSSAALSNTGSSATGVWSSSTPSVATIGSASGIVAAITAGTDTIMYTVTNICGTAKAMHLLTVNQTPSAGVITGTDSVCVGAIAVLSDTAAGGVWSTANGNASITAAGIVSGLVGGMDTVYYTVTKDGCTAHAMLPVKVIPLSECRALNTSEYSADNVRIYPNPNNGEFTISGTLSNSNNERILVEVLNTVGQVIFRTSLAVQNGVINSQLQLDRSLPGGMYNVIVRQGDMKLSYTIAKQQ